MINTYTVDDCYWLLTHSAVHTRVKEVEFSFYSGSVPHFYARWSQFSRMRSGAELVSRVHCFLRNYGVELWSGGEDFRLTSDGRLVHWTVRNTSACWINLRMRFVKEKFGNSVEQSQEMWYFDNLSINRGI